jgi:hypothetical protein
MGDDRNVFLGEELLHYSIQYIEFGEMLREPSLSVGIEKIAKDENFAVVVPKRSRRREKCWHQCDFCVPDTEMCLCHILYLL